VPIDLNENMKLIVLIECYFCVRGYFRKTETTLQLSVSVPIHQRRSAFRHDFLAKCIDVTVTVLCDLSLFSLTFFYVVDVSCWHLYECICAVIRLFGYNNNV